MSKAESRQLTFAFADSPQGDGPAANTDVSVFQAWLSLTAEVKEGKTQPPARHRPEQVSYRQRWLLERARPRLEEPDV